MQLVNLIHLFLLSNESDAVDEEILAAGFPDRSLSSTLISVTEKTTQFKVIVLCVQ